MANSSSYDHDIPAFFSTFSPETSSKKLLICPAFTATHFDMRPREVPREAKITRPGTNQAWNVELVRRGSDFYFEGGWDKFVEDNKLDCRESLVFRYHGGSDFSVYIYGIHACLKESVQEGEENADVEFVDDNMEEEEEVLVNGKRPRAGRPSTEDPSSEAVKAAKFYMKVHKKYPSFRVPIGHGYRKHNLMNIPLPFVDRYMKGGGDKRTLSLQVMNNTWRDITMIVYRDTKSPNCKLTKGVSAFVEDNQIKEGDVCVFELVKHDTFKVSIFPC